ncbi:hypothetical protein MDA_GLEAN10010790 [Myotis davidii]|uniref:Uncharacterized protein n=1 Tax=Myotis davidii TaxID=225400 RepID=L5MFV7_MYODS|nr:hypothetical protein MDA_GLEAN10010790 [Myotis davidii]
MPPDKSSEFRPSLTPSDSSFSRNSSPACCAALEHLWSLSAQLSHKLPLALRHERESGLGNGDASRGAEAGFLLLLLLLLLLHIGSARGPAAQLGISGCSLNTLPPGSLSSRTKGFISKPQP